VTPPNRFLLVNGLKANVRSNGQWVATGVPLDQSGVAVLDVLAIPPTQQPPNLNTQGAETNLEIKPVESASISAAYSPTEILLNMSQPTYGPFNLHLTGTQGQSFVLQDSTNLLDWSPILTNLNSAATFDYYDTNMLQYGCRFFRVLPVR
jgi:hypothetical protein